MTPDDFTRVNSDSYGNPRFVVHFLQCEPESWEDYTMTLDERYNRACKLMNKIHGRKFHNKQYGGGIVFQSYNIEATIKRIEQLKSEIDGGVK